MGIKSWSLRDGVLEGEGWGRRCWTDWLEAAVKTEHCPPVRRLLGETRWIWVEGILGPALSSAVGVLGSLGFWNLGLRDLQRYL